MKPGTMDLPRRSMRCVLGPARRVMSALLPTAMMREPRTATACAIWKVSLTVMIFPLVRMRSAGVCCACSDNDSPTTPLNSSSQTNFFITFLHAARLRAERFGGAGSPVFPVPGLYYWSFKPEANVMQTRIFAGSLALSIVALMTVTASHIGAQVSAALTGVVSSQEEGPMEGVVVSAKRAGSTMTVTVMTDAQGRYAFPGSRLEPGAYAIRIRAT